MTKVFSAMAILALLLSGCSMFSAQSSLPSSHPERLSIGRPVCGDCHQGETKGTLKPYTAYNHTDTFVVAGHRFAAGRDERVCALCHAASFCYDCHGTRIEIKPATKLGNRPDRELIHRGDFLTRHRFEGKLDPASCYACHGRANNESCVTCHR